MKKLFFGVIAAAMFAACTSTPDNSYVVNGTVSDLDGQAVVLMSGRDTIAVDTIRNGAFSFKEVADSIPTMVTVMADRQHYAQFFNEVGTITVDLNESTAKGTALNDQMTALTDTMKTVMAAFREDGANQDSLSEVYTSIVNEFTEKNAGNPLGLLLFQQQAYDLTKAQLDSVMALYPLYANNESLQKLSVKKINEENTAAGKPYVDIKGTDLEGNEKTLSAIVAEGKPVIVDFWASWCGPCRNEIKTALSVYAPQYKGKVNFVGVAVWENSIEDTKKAVEELPISWPVIYDVNGRGDDCCTTAYGISGIPQIILIGADGIIKARDLRGEAIAAAIEAELAK